MMAVERGVHANPSPEQPANWEQRGQAEHPLMWTHESGRKSLVLGATADYVVGMDEDESRALLHELLDRAMQPELVLARTWSLGDTVMWDTYRHVAPCDALGPGFAAPNTPHNDRRHRNASERPRGDRYTRRSRHRPS